MIRVLLTMLAFVALPSGVFAERDQSKAYFFGNSLINHLSEDADHTNVPHWINQMAKASGRQFSTDGQWGFLRNFADGLPPSANWSFPGVRGAWSPDRNAFGEAEFDAVVVAPANFIQYQLPDVPYDGDNPTGDSPLTALLRLFDWTTKNSPGSRLYVYEGWAAMGEVTGSFPPNAAAFERYLAFNADQHVGWYDELAEDIAKARPNLVVRRVPTARILSSLLAEGGQLSGLPSEVFFTDDAPHGTESLYLLVAMITYAAIFETPPPADWQPPATMHPDLVQAYPQIAGLIWEAMPETPQEAAQAVAVEQAVAEQAEQAPLPERQPVALPPRGIRPDGAPALGMGLNGVADWSTQHPFIDLMKTARDWVGHLPDQWGGFTSEQLRAGGHLDENGWPIAMPEGVERLEAVLLTDQPEEAEHLRGDYVLLYDGTGEIELSGRVRRVRYEQGQITFSYAPGDGLVGVVIKKIPENDPIRNIRILRQDHIDLHEAGVLFNPLWVERIRDLRSVRFMDWMMTNGSPIQSWEDRPRLTDANWTTWGVPHEVMIQLANQIGADPWFTMPHLADDVYVRRFAEAVKDGLDPGLKAYVEYSNEVWNFIFPQAVWAGQQAELRWGESETGWMQFYGLRAAQVMDVWTDVFGSEVSDRLVRVVSTHTGWPGLEESILEAPLAFLTLGRAPSESFDAYAVTGYFGYEMGGAEMAPIMTEWLDRAEALAEAEGRRQGLRRVALREFVKQNRFEAAIAPVALALQEGSLQELTQEIFPYHGAAARKAGLRLVMYEGGTHVAGHGAQVNDERLTDFFTEFNYTPEMAKLYEFLLTGWVESGGTLFNAFVDVAPATQWGSWGALRHLNDANPRWDMLMAFNASAPTGWEQREASVFADGITRIAGSGNQRLQGTSQEDVLIAGSGNDTLISSGGSDHMHGGTGQDRAVLPGVSNDYVFTREGEQLIADGPRGRVTLTAIETLAFEGAPNQSVPVSEF
ncbi:calcium-binding protein [Thalassococcus lentus]|uniref:Calcium-binding protein n=1 Tax=Thalassococcus lentus TaxID=1210524 RepID=A0ABT4XNG6_9RHOB|nr:calcium-binding protein [Thalassococcus lentus]MDA7423491.1 calcium-binding protein [Thalassococcus lentus]